MADPRTQTGLRQSLFDPPQRSPCARGYRVAVLVEEHPRRPGESVIDDAQRVDVDAYPLVADNTDVIGEGDTGLIDSEAVPGWARPEAWIGESARATRRDGLGQGQARWVDDGSDDEASAVGSAGLAHCCFRRGWAV